MHIGRVLAGDMLEMVNSVNKSLQVFLVSLATFHSSSNDWAAKPSAIWHDGQKVHIDDMYSYTIPAQLWQLPWIAVPFEHHVFHECSAREDSCKLMQITLRFRKNS